VKGRKKNLQVPPEQVPEIMKELALYSSIINVDNLKGKEKKLLIDLFLDYKLDGFDSSTALKKAKLVLENFYF
jgi:hypothetical protein